MMKAQSPSELEKSYSPVHWGYALANAEKAYMADSPTICDYIDAFGAINASLWIQGQVLALFGSSSNKDKGIADGIEVFCDTFSLEVKAFKLSELMLFFARYKAGKYDNSFSSFDARRIGNAFFKEFLPERQCEIARYERHRAQKDIENRRFVPPEGYSSLTWYQEVKRRAASGDVSAAALLKSNLRHG